MNEIYELAIESAEVELVVTEGFADKAKAAGSKVIEKFKVFIKKFIVFIKDKLGKFAKYIEKLAHKLASMNEMADNKMIDVPVCIILDDTSRTVVSIDNKVKRVINDLKSNNDIDEDDLDFSEERQKISYIYLTHTHNISVREAKKEVLTILSYIHNRNDIIIDRIKGLSGLMDQLEKSTTGKNVGSVNKQISAIQKLISIEQAVVSYNTKTLEKCLELVKRIGNKDLKKEVGFTKRLEDQLTKPVLN